jgi:hypothetical protein
VLVVYLYLISSDKLLRHSNLYIRGLLAKTTSDMRGDNHLVYTDFNKALACRVGIPQTACLQNVDTIFLNNGFGVWEAEKATRIELGNIEYNRKEILVSEFLI